MPGQTIKTMAHDPFTDPDSLVITYRGARLALYYVDGDNNGGEYIAVEGFTPEVAHDLAEELAGLPVLAEDRLRDQIDAYHAGQRAAAASLKLITP